MIIEAGDTLMMGRDHVLVVKTGRYVGEIVMMSSACFKLIRSAYNIIDPTKIYKVSFLSKTETRSTKEFENFFDKLCILPYEITKEEHSTGMSLITSDILEVKDVMKHKKSIYTFIPNCINEVLNEARQDYRYILHGYEQKETYSERHACDILWPTCN